MFKKSSLIMLVLLGSFAAASPGYTGSEQGEQSVVQEPPATTTVSYTDPARCFEIDYPSDFTVMSRDVRDLVTATPQPLEAIYFMNPDMARGNLAGIEPADLEIRVYHKGMAGSLTDWLSSAGLSGPEHGTYNRPYPGLHFSGMEVCHATMIAPGCSLYAIHGEHVFQLTAGSREGFMMIDTFRFRHSAPGLSSSAS